MSFNEVMQRILPGQQSAAPHVTGHYGEMRANGPHGGTDFNYVGGQNGINLQHPTVHAPIDGQVIFAGGQFGTIKIRDAEGNSHEILHTHSQTVQVGQLVTAGDPIGTMGGRGPAGPNVYAQHVHYQMKDPQGQRINPQEWWNQHEIAPNPSPPTPVITPATAKLTQPTFKFPFRKKAGASGGTEITDEHDWHALLARESAGSYLVSGDGMWHGGIHITEAGAGQGLDLAHGIRCIAGGEIIAYRVNRVDPLSEMPAGEGTPALQAPYSTGFTLVRHVMEFPQDNRLTFYSLYMHLQTLADYEANSMLRRPLYWPTCFEVTEHASDPPNASANGLAAPPEQKGLRARATPSVSGAVAGILPQGAQVRIGTRHGKWGRITEVFEGGQPFPPTAGGWVEAQTLVGKWVFLGKQNGHLLAREVIADEALDQIVVPSTPIPIKAGDLIGHLGRQDDLTNPVACRMAHIEVFCDDGIHAFIEQSRAWVNTHGGQANAWVQYKLPAEPTLLRIDGQTALYHEPNKEDTNPSLTDVVQTYALAELARRPDGQFVEAEPGADGQKRRWWKVHSADTLRHPISGWVREQNFAGGRITREFAQSWVDFRPLEDEHDATHTVFDSTQTFVKCATGQATNPAALDKLSPLMTSVYRATYSAGSDAQAASRLCQARQDPWALVSMSRLIVKHESEWANPGKWKALVTAIEEETKPKPHHAAELQRIEAMAWWEEVQARVPGFPGPAVFHIHPAALVGNFQRPFAIIAGQITFDAEGNDLPNSPYFSRIIHWPGTTLSGVTLGRGYDMGSRTETEVCGHMISAGIPSEQAEKIAKAHGKKGASAQTFVAENKSDIGEISRDQQISLFNIIYPTYVSRTIDNYDKWTDSEPERVPWGDLSPVIRDILVDFVYQGFTQGPNPMRAGMRNGIDELIFYIENTPTIRQYENGRHRAEYLRKNR